MLRESPLKLSFQLFFFRMKFAIKGKMSTVSAPPVTIVAAVIWSIISEDAAICVTATMIGSPVAEYKPKAICSLNDSMPEYVLLQHSRSEERRVGKACT